MYMAMSCMQVSSLMHTMTGKCLHVATVLQPLSSLPCGRVVQLNQRRRKPPCKMHADATLYTPFEDRF